MKAWIASGAVVLLSLAGCRQAADLADEQERREQNESASAAGEEALANNPMRDRTPEEALAFLREQEGGASEENISRYRNDLVSLLISEGIDPNRADVTADRFIGLLREKMTSEE